MSPRLWPTSNLTEHSKNRVYGLAAATEPAAAGFASEEFPPGGFLGLAKAVARNKTRLLSAPRISLSAQTRPDPNGSKKERRFGAKNASIRSSRSVSRGIFGRIKEEKLP
ncbi:MAG: hypothetical protein HYS06_02575 [Methylocystis sp.]|nr:hypothetical protein [Methylocystis sp.]